MARSICPVCERNVCVCGPASLVYPEVERLRALLAEARNHMSPGCSCGQDRCLGTQRNELFRNIDAALAEPVEPTTENTSRFGCGDNSCIFKVLSPGGMGTNGGCRCFKDLESWLNGEKRWNRPEVRRVEQAARMLSQRVYQAERERDEALARCETLRQLADTAAAEQGLAQRRMMEAQKQRDEARAEVERLREEDRFLREEAIPAARVTSYERGAEAMREAAVRAVSYDEYADLIRALPIPEDKP